MVRSSKMAMVRNLEMFDDAVEFIVLPLLLAHIIHERFHCNHRYAAATGLAAGFRTQAGRLAAWSVNIRFQVCFPSSRLRVGVPIALLHAMGPTLGVFGYPLLGAPIALPMAMGPSNGWNVTNRHE
jgi:hypothetical protein